LNSDYIDEYVTKNKIESEFAATLQVNVINNLYSIKFIVEKKSKLKEDEHKVIFFHLLFFLKTYNIYILNL
jgi:hypothetical protein